MNPSHNSLIVTVCNPSGKFIVKQSSVNLPLPCIFPYAINTLQRDYLNSSLLSASPVIYYHICLYMALIVKHTIVFHSCANSSATILQEQIKHNLN